MSAIIYFVGENMNKTNKKNSEFNVGGLPHDDKVNIKKTLFGLDREQFSKRTTNLFILFLVVVIISLIVYSYGIEKAYNELAVTCNNKIRELTQSFPPLWNN